MKTIKKLERILNSLDMSGVLKITFKHEGYVLSKRNSPYVSHKGFEMIQGHGIEHVCIISNERNKIIISDNDIDVKNGVKIRLPSFLLTKIFAELVLNVVPVWCKDTYHLNYYISETMVSYDNENIPSYTDLEMII